MSADGTLRELKAVDSGNVVLTILHFFQGSFNLRMYLNYLLIFVRESEELAVR